MLVKKLKYLVIGLILIASIYPLGSAYLENREKEKSARNMESSVILYTLENHQFNVPLKYNYLLYKQVDNVYQKTGQWHTPNNEITNFGPDIFVIFPDMLPYSKKTSDKFSTRDFGDIVSIRLRGHKYDIGGFQGWFQKLRDHFTVASSSITVVGFSHEVPNLLHVIDDEGPMVKNKHVHKDMFVKPINELNDFFYIACRRYLNEESDLTPSCKLYTTYGNSRLVITFSRNHVSDWEKIMDSSVILLDSFKMS